MNFSVGSHLSLCFLSKVGVLRIANAHWAHHVLDILCTLCFVEERSQRLELIKRKIKQLREKRHVVFRYCPVRYSETHSFCYSDDENNSWNNVSVWNKRWQGCISSMQNTLICLWGTSCFMSWTALSVWSYSDLRVDQKNRVNQTKTTSNFL